VKIYFSQSDYLRNFDRFVAAADLSSPETLTIESHPRWLNVHPAVLVFAATLALKAGAENVRLPDFTAASAGYFDRMGLFKFTTQKSPCSIVHKESAGRFIPLSVIKTPEDQSRFISEMIPLLHLPPAKADAIRYVVGELVRNVLEHACCPSGAVVAAQYYKKSGTVRIGICDGGIGIRESMARAWPQHALTDIDAIKWALVPGVSGTTSNEGGTEENAGAGLFFIKSIARAARNYFMVYSGTGIYKLLLADGRAAWRTINPDPNDDPHTERDDAPFFQGTLVAIDLSLDTAGGREKSAFATGGVAGDRFARLLAEIRESYGRAIRERKQRKYKQPLWR